jgi:polar amino acid transport system substrate-binding protein
MATSRRVPLRVASAFPDPPFEVPGPTPSGLDQDLIRALAEVLDRPVELHPYEGADFDGIFAGLGHTVDVVASGATITDHRRTLARWCAPYVRSGQSLVVNVDATPTVHSMDDLHGLVVGVQEGNTSEPVARRLHEAGKVADVRTYPYDGIVHALDDLDAGAIGGFMKLEPVMRWLTRDRPHLGVVQTGITDELLAVAVALDDATLADQIEAAQRALVTDGRLAALGARWFADSDPAATKVVT